MRSQADAAPAWLLAPALGEIGSRIELAPDQQHYLRRVCRARPGDRVHVTDGGGAVAHVVLALDANGFCGTIEQRERRARAAHAQLLCGAPEAGRADWLIEKLGELGVAVFQPVNSERAAWSGSDVRIDRWRRLAEAALRQSRRAFLLEVLPPVSLEQAMSSLPPGTRLWLADEAGTRAGDVRPERAPCAGLIGPAAGFSDSERDSIVERAATAICLSGARLRTETAALAWAAWWSGAGLSGTTPEA